MKNGVKYVYMFTMEEKSDRNRTNEIGRKRYCVYEHMPRCKEKKK